MGVLKYLPLVALVAPAVLLGSWSIKGVRTGEWNLRTQIQSNIQKNDKIEVEEKRKRALYHDVFGKGGLADVDGNGELSYHEMRVACNRAGLKSRGTGALGQARIYYSASVENLEKAVESYEAEK